MPITRTFIDPRSHALPAAVDYLFERFVVSRTADLGNVVVVLPGSRAGRRLLEILVDVAEQRDLDLVPPDICTVGSLPELLYQPQRPFASELAEQLAWAQALAAADRTALSQVVRNPPADQDVAAWRELGQLLLRTHRELAAEGLNFRNVVRATEDVGEANESGRWDVLRSVQKAYLARLDSLELWDRQTARLVAIAEKECATDRQIVLVGAVDINQALRQMLDQVADQVTALVPALDAWSDRFDEHGCLLPDAWTQAEVVFPDGQIHVADDPTDVADSVVRCVARLSGRRADEITVGVPDERMASQIERAVEQCGLPARWGPGRPLAEAGPCRLLQAIRRYVSDGRYEDFAALVRHPDVFDWVVRNGVGGDWLTELDEYFGEHLPARLPRNWLGSGSKRRSIERVASLIDRLVRPLQGPDRPLGNWTSPVLDILKTIYGDRQFDRDVPAGRAVLTACDRIHAVLQEHESGIPAELMPKVSAETAVGIAPDRLRSETVPAPVDRAAIELLGWLELPLDDASAMIVTNVNEGLIPAAVNADLLLPDTLRRRLGLEDNARRYARDAYALSVILAARDDVQLIVARRNADNDPLAPSRLLFAADGETVARRALRFFGDPPAADPRRPLLPGGPRADRHSFDFPYLKPKRLAQPITSLSPTGFRSYLACPYRFYLQHVLRLEPLADDSRELDGASYGTLLHEVLRRFGESEHRDSTDTDEIRGVFHRTLEELAKQSFGAHPLAAVSVQVEQAHLRLDAFAERQAVWAGEWRIEHTELYIAEQQAPLVVDGSPFYLRGRVDRVDVHRETGQRVVLDYKSSDTASTPEKSHQRGGAWVDLQLPLYRHLVQGFEIEGPVALGYVQLPRDVKKVEFQLAQWSAEELAGADEAAAEVIRAIRNGRFWPPTDPPPDFSEAYAWICHDGVFDKPPFGGD